MDVIQFLIHKYPKPNEEADATCEERIDAIINGLPLVDLLRHVEKPFAVAEGHEDMAGGYIAAPAAELAWPSELLLGHVSEEDDYLGCPGKVMLLECTCGEPGCWPLVARITATDTTVTWTDFEQPHRREATEAHPRWSYEALGSFTFDRRQYEEALRNPIRIP